MPTSPFSHIPIFINYLAVTRPDSILDIGLGNGKLGFLARDLLDVMMGERYRKEQWQVRIDGIEVFENYIQTFQREIYDHIYIGDAFDIIEQMDSYDMVILGDILEHFEKQKAWEFLDRCMVKAEKYIILNIPLGEAWTQPEIYENPYEKHLSFWSREELNPFIWKFKLFDFPPGKYGSFLIRKKDYTTYRYNQFMDHYHQP
ncbi:MAG: class I SAM-dependent methyltransferase [Desulfobacteraceae bacterium]|nr:class I SAM-dependent methyltransferase [Desulfobacteraceae bacterium]